jgi:hypothetical protein
MQNDIETDRIDFVKNTLLINHFCKILSLNSEDCLIVPLKGISLLLGIYKDDYSRNVGDIDIFVPENDRETLITNLKKTGYVFRNQNINNRLPSKRKFDMIHAGKKYCDLDIHTDLINKKFYRTSTGDFTSFALKRLTKTGYKHQPILLLSPVDEWLYLAQHYCFHLFSNDKWLIDLYLLQCRFSSEEISELVAVAKKFHFERVVTAVSRCLKSKYPQKEVKIPEIITKRHYVFDLLSCNHKYAYTFTNRIIAIYWEFVFIDHFFSRLKAYIQLLFPPLMVLSDIYNCRSKIIYLAYPVHLLLVILSSALFFPLLYYKRHHFVPCIF